MNDTAQEFSLLYRRKIMERSGEERLMMGDGMFRSSRGLVLASLAGTCDDHEKRFGLFLRFYAHDFTGMQQEQIKKLLLVRTG